MPAFRHDPRTVPFIGRAEQLAQLKRALDAARDGTAATVIVGGEAGVGKSRLMQEFAALARGHDAHVLVARCEDFLGTPMPYGPLLDALDGFTREHGDDAAAVGGPAYLRLMQFFAADAESSAEPVGSTQQQLFIAVRQMLDNVGRDKPVVLLLEDLHWADVSTLELVRHLAHTQSAGRNLLLVGSYRHQHPAAQRGQPLGRMLNASAFLRHSQRMTLPRFDRGEMSAFLREINDGPVAPDLIERCFTRSDGIPLHAELLINAGALDGPEDADLPDYVRSVVTDELDVLDDGAVRVLRVAAVAGRRMSRLLLRTVSGLPADPLTSALQQCYDRHLLVDEHGGEIYRFRHALLRDAVYQETVPEMRIELHLAMARALEADPRLSVTEGLAVAEQATHWYEAREWSSALAAGVRAGQAAVRTLAFASAENQFTRVLTDVWHRFPDAEKQAGLSHVELLAATADAARWSGHVDAALNHVGRAIAETDPVTHPDLAGELHERLGNYLWEASRRDESMAAYRRADELLRGGPESPVTVRVQAGLALAELRAGHYADGLPIAERALRMAQSVGARVEEGRALNIWGLAIAMLGSPNVGVERVRAALGIARAAEHTEDLFRAYGNLVLVLEVGGRLAESVEVALEGLAEAMHIGLENSRQGVLLANNAAAVLASTGNWERAENILNQLLVGRSAADSLYAHLTMADVKVARGEFATANRLFRAIDGADQVADTRFLGPLHAARAEMALWRDQLDEARQEIAGGLRAVGGGENHLEALRLCAIGLRCLADGSSKPDDKAGAELSRRALQARDRGSSFPEVRQVAVLCTAELHRLGRRDTAAEWRGVATGWAGLDRRYPAAYARWREAAAALTAGDRRVGRTAVLAAYEAADELGAKPLRRRVHNLARSAGIELREVPAAQQYPHGLTKAEFDVLKAIYDGADARTVAQRRGVSKRTVDTQLGRIYAKLEVNTGPAAITLARRENFFVEDAS